MELDTLYTLCSELEGYIIQDHGWVSESAWEVEGLVE